MKSCALKKIFSKWKKVNKLWILGDILSLKRIMSHIVPIQFQLKEAQEKQTEDSKLAETHILSMKENIAK